jgi:rSAM/selenodomain-associated transferase 1
MSPSGTLVVFAKAPEAGRVKTRLVPPLSVEEARDLYGCLLADALETSARAAAQLGLEPVLAVDPPLALASLALTAPPTFRLVVQRGGDLGRRMQWAVEEAAAGGSTPVLLRGSDSPTLDTARIAQAVSALGHADLVICPDRDGGYNLVGLRGPAPGLFAHPMSTSSVLRDTLARAESLGLRAHLLDAGFDLDRIEDLRWLAEARAREPVLPCPRTLAYLDERDLWRRRRSREARPQRADTER